LYLVNRYYDPSTAQFSSVDPLVDITQQPYAYVGDNPLNNTDPAGLGVSCSYSCASYQKIVAECTSASPPKGCNGSGWWAGVVNGISQVPGEIWQWANTPTCLSSPDFFTAPLNGFYGGFKIASGGLLVTLGTAEDVTGLGTVLGIPTQSYGVYQIGTGGARVYRSYRQFSGAFSQAEVQKTPLEYGEDLLLNIAPFGGGLTDLLGGLP
jgi:hypothetical protein